MKKWLLMISTLTAIVGLVGCGKEHVVAALGYMAFYYSYRAESGFALLAAFANIVRMNKKLYYPSVGHPIIDIICDRGLGTFFFIKSRLIEIDRDLNGGKGLVFVFGVVQRKAWE